MRIFINQTALIWGNQGGGKSWLARYIVQLKIEFGYQVIVLDPNSNRAEWQGLKSYHKAADIKRIIEWYVEELDRRYEEFADSLILEEEWRSQLWRNGKAITLVCEEVTTWGNLIKDRELLQKFGEYALTKSRKQEMPILIVSHNNTQSCLFGISGLYNLVSKMLQLQCLSEVNMKTLKPSATGKAKVKLDSSNDWIDVELPKLESKIINFSDGLPLEGVSNNQDFHSDNNLNNENRADNSGLTFSQLFKLDNHLRVILDLAIASQNWVTVREVSRKDYAALKGKSAEDIKGYFSELSKMGYGEVDCQGQTIRFKVHQPEPSQNTPDSKEENPPDT